MTTVAEKLSTILMDQLDRMEADYYRNCDYSPVLEDEFELGIHQGIVSAIYQVKGGDLDLSGLIKEQEWESRNRLPFFFDIVKPGYFIIIPI